jgi:hypothetical protein
MLEKLFYVLDKYFMIYKMKEKKEKLKTYIYWDWKNYVPSLMIDYMKNYKNILMLNFYGYKKNTGTKEQMHMLDLDIKEF